MVKSIAKHYKDCHNLDVEENLEKEEEGDKAQVKAQVADQDYTCSICDVTFASAQVLQWHINEHNEVYVRQCCFWVRVTRVNFDAFFSHTNVILATRSRATTDPL